MPAGGSATTGTVRDVAQDRIEAQMRASGATQTIAILPQGISHSRFGKVLTDPYIQAVLARLRDRGVKLHKDIASSCRRTAAAGIPSLPT
jgi:hypothetical protein